MTVPWRGHCATRQHRRDAPACGERPRRGPAKCGPLEGRTARTIGADSSPRGGTRPAVSRRIHRVPAQGDDLLEQPPCIQATIGHYSDRPGGIDLVGEPAQQLQPLGLPGMRSVAPRDLPGDRDGRPAIDQTQRQDGEPVGEAGRIQRQGHPRSRPVLEDPGQQRCETGGDVEFAAVRSRLLGSRLVPFAEPLADRVVAPADQGTEIATSSSSKLPSSLSGSRPRPAPTRPARPTAALHWPSAGPRHRPRRRRRRADQLPRHPGLPPGAV